MVSKLVQLVKIKNEGQSETTSGQDEQQTEHVLLRKQSSIKIEDKMTPAQLQKAQTEEDEQMRQYNDVQMKNTKLKQFRGKYLKHKVYIHLCSECKRYGMMLHQEGCVLCGSPNLFYRTGLDLPEPLVNEIMEDIMRIEDPSTNEIAPAKDQAELS